ncbi:MAG: WecB/TagA/CpsF family glycosyltransferase [Planctomycetota bacterium]
MHEVSMPSAQKAESRPRRLTLDGIELDPLTLEDTVGHILAESSRGRGGWVITANLDHLCRAKRDAAYRTMLAEADLVVADGMPLIWASRLRGKPLPERVAGSSMVEPLVKRMADSGRSVFLLGGNPGVAEEAGAFLIDKYQKLNVCGTLCPPMGFESDPDEMDRIRQALVDAHPDVVLVALGSPKQERLIREVRGLLPSAWWLGVGISLSFLAGEVSRAPSWMQKLGLEWCHRLWQEPGRLAKRYLVYGLPFAMRLLVGSAWIGLVGRGRG